MVQDPVGERHPAAADSAAGRGDGVLQLLGRERAFEHADLKHGVFFHYVIEGLNGNATGEGSEGVTMPELELYVKKQVHDFVRAKYGSRQMPELKGDSRGLVPIVTLDRAMLAYKFTKALKDRGQIERPDRLRRAPGSTPSWPGPISTGALSGQVGVPNGPWMTSTRRPGAA